MNENLKLNEILIGYEDEFFYSPVFGIIQYKGFDGAFLKFISNGVVEVLLNPNGKFVDSADEIAVYPSETEKDWNKWYDNKQIHPKTWFDFKEISGVRNYSLDYDVTGPELPLSVSEEKICSAAIYLIRIQQLIDLSYGGRVCYHDFAYGDKPIFIIVPTADSFEIKEVLTECSFSHIAFHTKEQAKEFLKYDENRHLLKFYFTMINEC